MITGCHHRRVPGDDVFAGDPELLARLQTAVDEANKAVGPAESIRRFRVLPVDLTEENEYLTPTQKVKRALVQRDFTAEIEELYR